MTRELDAAVAEKVMKLSYILFDGTDKDADELIPEYSRDISAAWLVVEKMIADGWEFSIEYANWNEVEGEPLEYGWWCAFAYYTDDEEDHKYVNANGEPSEAICLAALAAVDAGR